MKYKDLVNKVLELEKIVKEKELKPIGEREKITLKDFFESKEKLAIHCDTIEKAKVLLNAFDSYGKRWINDMSYTKENNYYVYEDKTCYENNGYYCGVDYCNDNYIKMYEFEDVILPKWTFTEDEKVILRNVPKEFEWIARDKDGRLFVYDKKPKKETSGIWYLFMSNNQRFFIFENIFQTIKWEDDEPCEFRKYI